ncbi:MAG: 4'-phosphopantetheinyl transferase [Pseudohongiellaceae bacterium]|jgi:4'-phosphopantetheinyl transferase
MKLDPQHIDLWFVNIEDFSYEELLSLTSGWLSKQDLQRVERYQFLEHKQQLLMGRYLIRTVLSRYGQLSAGDWRFENNEYGKPFIASALLDEMVEPLFFNLSHSQNKLVLAVARHEFLGVDIEYGLKPRRVEKIANRYFSNSEIEGFSGLEKSQMQKRFYDLWSLKEAYIKACGMGLAIPLNHFSFSFQNERKVEIKFHKERPDDSALWQFWNIESEPGYHLSLAVKSLKLDGFSATKISSFYQLKSAGELVSKQFTLRATSH